MKTTHISTHLVAGVVIAALLVGFAFGQLMTPEYRAHMYAPAQMDLGSAGALVDLRYVNAMISHHVVAMRLAEQLAQNSKRPAMQELAKSILADEPSAIAELYAWKKQWYQDARTVPDPAVPNLGPAGETFDLRFINAMIAHHQEGINMTREIRTKSVRPEVLDNADKVEAFLINGIQTLEALRSEWYATP